MAREFYSATAEQLVAAVEAVHTSGNADVGFVATFCDLPQEYAQRALGLGVDIGFLEKTGGNYRPRGPLCRFLALPSEQVKAAVVRVLLESYEPFERFRDRLRATGSVDDAARQTQQLLELDSHREPIKDTLISLGTYAGAIEAEGGGKYRPVEGDVPQSLLALSKACKDTASAENEIRRHLGNCAGTVSRDDVLLPLADALLKAAAGQAADAVRAAGNAIESYLSELAGRINVNVTGASGINAKLDRFAQNGALPKKLVGAGKYLGHVRNAGDHGVDPDIGQAWSVQGSTGLDYVHVACSFLRACHEREQNGPFVI
jgi:hypothetical protein